MEVMGAWRAHYDRAAFVDLGIGDATTARKKAQAEAIARGWTFVPIEGSAILVRRLIDGAWDERDFLTIRPGEQLAMSYADDVVRAIPANVASAE